MNNLNTFTEFITESFDDNRFIVYHGARSPHDFSDTGYISKGTFFSDRIEVAESFGSFIYEVVLYNDIDLFDSTSVNDNEKILAQFNSVYDKPYRLNDREELVDASHMASNADTWEIIENNEGVLDWIIDEGYEGVTLREKGEITYLLFNPSECIESYKIIKTIRE